MSRTIVLDTETTGLYSAKGDRIIEIGAVEMVDRRRTGEHFHCYCNPEREVDEEAVRVHGITDEFLADKPLFKDIAPEFLKFIAGAELVIHNAEFDLGFLNMECARLGLPPVTEGTTGVVDTWLMAKNEAAGKRTSLDALCSRYGIKNEHRKFHGALLDAELLADVYIAMTRGQAALLGDAEMEAAPVAGGQTHAPMEKVIVLPADPDEVAAHAQYLKDLSKEMGKKDEPGTLWEKLDSSSASSARPAP